MMEAECQKINVYKYIYIYIIYIYRKLARVGFESSPRPCAYRAHGLSTVIILYIYIYIYTHTHIYISIIYRLIT